ncbi:MAG: hypothetical protein H8E66_23135 [Planctomycetes bacterium]|nr:hypothetical protein [Planctomycetota bacterium]
MEVLSVLACVVAVIALALLVGATRRVRLLEDQIKQVLAGRDADQLLASGSHELERTQRRWLSFRLRSLLMWVAIAACLLGWFGSELRRAKRQRVAVNTFESLGAAITYNFNEYDARDCFPSDRRPPLPRWTRQLFGDDFGSRVLAIRFEAPLGGGFGGWQWGTPGFGNKSFDLTDDDLKLLRDLPDVTYVNLCYTDVTDDGLRHLVGLHDLKRLSLASTHVTGSRLAELEMLPRLDWLDLNGSKATDQAMTAVSALPHLTELIASQHVTDAGLAALSASTTIEALDLTRAPISDSGLRHVAKMQQLTALKLNETMIGNAGLQHLQRLPNLKVLHLDGTQVTCDGLAQLKDLPRLHALSLLSLKFECDLVEHLAGLEQLQQLSLPADSILEDERDRLRASLPDTRIDFAEPLGMIGGGGGF